MGALDNVWIGMAAEEIVTWDDGGSFRGTHAAGLMRRRG
jgi:hypothetical protein